MSKILALLPTGAEESIYRLDMFTNQPGVQVTISPEVSTYTRADTVFYRFILAMASTQRCPFLAKKVKGGLQAFTLNTLALPSSMKV